jgi:hypothetical protein
MSEKKKRIKRLKRPSEAISKSNCKKALGVPYRKNEILFPSYLKEVGKKATDFLSVNELSKVTGLSRIDILTSLGRI